MGRLFARRLAYHEGGAAKALGTSFAAGDKSMAGPANMLNLGIVISGNSMSVGGAEIQWSDNDTDWYPADIIESISGGEVNTDDGEWIFPGSVGNHTITARIVPGCLYRCRLKRYGGSAATKALARAVLTEE